MTDKEKKQKYGVTMAPTPCTRLYVADMEYFLTQTPKVVAKKFIVINDATGTYQSAQTYDGRLGKGYDAAESGLVRALPEAASHKWKEWRKEYVLADGLEGRPSIKDFDTFVAVSQTASKPTPVSVK